MAEPVTNAKIEDVLSSIRRLVSEDNRPDTDRARAEPAPEDDADTAGRLVLTPALRVHQPLAAQVEVETEAEAGPLDTAVTEPVAPEQAGAASAPWADPSATLFSATRADAVHIAPEGEPDVDAGEAAAEVAGSAAEQEETLTFHSTRAESLSAKIEALEAVIGQTRDQWEPDGTGGDSYSGTPVRPIGWSEADEAAPEEDGEPAVEVFDIEDLSEEAPVDDDRQTDDLATDEAVIDEDSLRELVAEIVRQELQGALGERITRNVRKLVRREIHRALAAQDLE